MFKLIDARSKIIIYVNNDKQNFLENINAFYPMNIEFWIEVIELVD